MDPPISWLSWFAISLPVASTSVVAIWAFLHVNYRWESDLKIPKMRKNTDSLSPTHYYVLAVSALTIVLWCMEKSVEGTVGDMGIIAIIPLLAFFGTGILSKVSACAGLTSAFMLTAAGGLPPLPLVDRVPGDGRYRSRQGDLVVGPVG
jgi:di/tricarboxylate transporter